MKMNIKERKLISSILSFNCFDWVREDYVSFADFLVSQGNTNKHLINLFISDGNSFEMKVKLERFFRDCELDVFDRDQYLIYYSLIICEGVIDKTISEYDGFRKIHKEIFYELKRYDPDLEHICCLGWQIEDIEEIPGLKAKQKFEMCETATLKIREFAALFIEKHKPSMDVWVNHTLTHIKNHSK